MTAIPAEVIRSLLEYDPTAAYAKGALAAFGDFCPDYVREVA